MQRLEAVRHECLGRSRAVDGHRQDEERAVSHVPDPIHCIAPLAAEISLEAPLGVHRHHRNEVRAAADVPLDLAIVIVADLQSVHVEPGRDACRLEASLNLLHGGEVLARVADEDCVIRHLSGRRQKAGWRLRLRRVRGGPAACLPTLVQLGDEALRADVDTRPDAHLLQEGHQPRIVARVVVGEHLAHVTRI